MLQQRPNKINNKLEEMKKECAVFQEEMKKIMIEMRTSVDEKIDKLADKVEDQTSKMANFKKKVNKMTKRIH